LVVTGPDRGGGPHVIVRADTNQDGALDTVTASFMAYDQNFRGGVRVAMGDFDGDGRQELVTAAGVGGGPHVKIWDLDASGGLVDLREEFMAYESNFRGGVWLATGDFDLDGREELVVAPDFGGGPHVKVFSDVDGDGRLSDTVTDSFMAYDPTFRGGVRVAVGTFDSAHLSPFGGTRIRGPQLVTAPGPGGAPHVKVFENRDFDRQVSNQDIARQFLAFDSNFHGGVFVAATELDRSELSHLVVSAGAGGGPHVKIFRLGFLTMLGGPPYPVMYHEERDSFLAFDPNFRGGVRVATVDLNPTDPNPDVITAPGPGGGSRVTIWSGDGLNGKVSDSPPDDIFSAYPGFNGGVFVAAGTT
jgi:hypothetical protein